MSGAFLVLKHSPPIKVLFVCLGNICRSPSAQGVFETMVADAGLADSIAVDSSGTGNWHVGQPPDSRATTAAGWRGYALDHLRARQVHSGDFEQFHYIVAMDKQNLSELKTLCPENFSGELTLLLDYADTALEEVPDPYYGEDDGFEQMLDLIERASTKLLEDIQRRHAMPGAAC